MRGDYAALVSGAVDARLFEAVKLRPSPADAWVTARGTRRSPDQLQTVSGFEAGFASPSETLHLLASSLAVLPAQGWQAEFPDGRRAVLTEDPRARDAAGLFLVAAIRPT